ncbi:LamG domain-containing protein, partial [bacterium]|nr:LamG domain-containing protein [bacterium]
NISIGLKGGSSYWPGSIDEVSIYSEAITIAKVRSDYITGINELLARNVITKNEYNQRLAKLEGNMAKK